MYQRKSIDAGIMDNTGGIAKERCNLMKSESSMAVNTLNIKQNKGGVKAMCKEDFIAVFEATLL